MAGAGRACNLCLREQQKVTRINWHRLGQLALVGMGTFAAIWAGSVVLALVWAPTSSPSRLVAFQSTMLAVTGAVLAVVIWAAGNRRGS